MLGVAAGIPSQVGQWTTYTNALPDPKLPDVPLLGNGQLGILLDAHSSATLEDGVAEGAAGSSISQVGSPHGAFANCEVFYLYFIIRF